MKRVASLFVLPVIGLALLAAGGWLGGADLRTSLFGEVARARLPGLWITRADGPADLLTGISTEMRLTAADGRVYVIHTRNHRALSVRSISADGSLVAAWDDTSLDPGKNAAPGSANLPSAFPPHLGPFLRKTIAGDIALLRGALRGEARRTKDPDRFVRAEKIEIIHGYLDLPTQTPGLRAVPSDSSHPVRPTDPALGPNRGEIRVHAVLDLSDPAALAERRGDSLVFYEYSRSGLAVAPAKRNFFLHAEPSSTEFRPVYAYEVNGESFVRVSHLGRMGGPTLALRLFHDARVIHRPDAPGKGVLLADPGPAEGQYLAWFSRFCEGLFSQWSLPLVLVCAGALKIFIGLLVISLVVKPGRHLDAG